MKDKTILGSWCTNPNCKFIDSKHIQVELVAHIWYSYDNDSKTDVISKKICFVNKIDFNELNDIVEIPEEPKGIPEKLEWNKNDFTYPEGNLMSEETADMLIEMQDKINEILDYLESKGE